MNDIIFNLIYHFLFLINIIMLSSRYADITQNTITIKKSINEFVPLIIGLRLNPNIRLFCRLILFTFSSKNKIPLTVESYFPTG